MARKPTAASVMIMAVLMLMAMAPTAAQAAYRSSTDQDEEWKNLEAEISFFHDKDTNKDGALSKKEFYYAIMEDEFEGFAKRHDFSVVDLEFEGQDKDGDKKIDLREWKGIFFHDSPQVPAYVDGLGDTTEPLESAEQESAPPVRKETKLQVDGEIADSRGLRFYLSEGATWYQSRTFCTMKNRRLCSYDEICPSINNDDKIPNEMKMKRWVPMRSKGHLWIEARNCGLTSFPDTAEHSGLIPCCSDSQDEMFDAKHPADDTGRVNTQGVAADAAASSFSTSGASGSSSKVNSSDTKPSTTISGEEKQHIETRFDGHAAAEKGDRDSSRSEEQLPDTDSAGKRSSKPKQEVPTTPAADPIAEQKAKLRAARSKAAPGGGQSSTKAGEAPKKGKR
eukprot:94734-Hanusia_phi.AAC.5